MESNSNQPNKPRTGWLRQLQRWLAGKPKALSEKDLQVLINESEEEGLINEGEGDMLHSVFQFGETIVREAMVPRTDMICCPVEAPFDQLLQSIIESGHTRLPIYEGTTDRIVGLVYAKDLLRHWGKDDATISIRRVMRPPFFVPETKKIEELLQDFKTRRIHLAIAVDEFGGTSGLITIEDLIEEIVGDIQDEYDLEEEMVVEEGDGSLLVDARINIDELEDHLECGFPNKDQFDTLAGYLFHVSGHVPAIGEEIRADGFCMIVVAADERRISRVRIRREPVGEGESDDV